VGKKISKLLVFKKQAVKDSQVNSCREIDIFILYSLIFFNKFFLYSIF